MKTKITIIGAGFSGLSLAYELRKLGVEVVVYEKASRVGGLIQTHRTEHGLVETAANGFMLSNAIEQLFAELNVELLKTNHSAKRRFIFKKSPRQWPLSFLETLQFVCKIFIQKFFVKKNWQPQPQQSIKNWALQNLGRAATDKLVSPGLQGIYTGPIEKLSASLILLPFFQKDREKFRGTVSAHRGMQEVIDALEKKLSQLGVSIFLNTTVDVLQIQGPVVLCTSASDAGQLLEKRAPAMSALLKKIKMNSLVTTTAFWQQSETKYRGFGCLIPQTDGFKTLGILMNSFIFAHRGPKYSETYIMHSANTLSDEQIISTIESERLQILKSSSQLVNAQITRWPEALPEYNLDLENILQDLKNENHVFLHGNYLGVIGLSKIYKRSQTLAKEIQSLYEK